jgi:hypothetical protein
MKYFSTRWGTCFLAGCLLLGSRVWGAEAPPLPPERDLRSDTWVATDALGRALPLGGAVGAPRPGKTVGMFYFLWLGRHGEEGPFDISKILAAHPGAFEDPRDLRWGPMYAPHHWGESVFDYYVSDDDGVLRKHAQMLADAGVDVIIFDVTNQLTYPESWRALCREFDALRRQGNRTPRIAFLCPFWEPRKVARELYEQLYQPNLYSHLWFRWEGKPLILADPKLIGERDAMDKAIQAAFTFRRPQPDYFTGPTGPGQWGWLETHPQHVFYKTPGQPEQMTVGVAQNATDGKLSVLSNPRSHGRSFHDGLEPVQKDATGRNYQEQWRRALAVSPAFIFLTGWNEWIAGRFDQQAPFYQPGPVAFVDEFNAEYSRDIEPMKGGHGDNYYWQTVDYIRRYKGAREIEPVARAAIRIDGRFDDWQAAGPEFRDTIGDAARRDYRGWGKGSRYRNQTGRNDIILAKVAYDAQRVYFYAQTRAPLTPTADPNWMLLFLNTDGNATNGWLGYDFALNRRVPAPYETVLERHVKTGYHWAAAGKAVCRASGCELELAVPLAALGIRSLPATIDFKWADNIQQTGDWSDFTLNGDAAPNDRFNYRAILR